MILLLALAVAAPDVSDPLVKEVARCLTIVDATERLACLDAGTRALIAGIERGDLSVMRREEVRRTRRNLFGIAGDPGGSLPGAAAERIDSLDTTD